MYICWKCGELFEDLKTERRYGDNYLGGFIDETIDTCPHCKVDLVEATKCPVCGRWFDNTELDGVCAHCLEDYETVGTALEIGDKNRIDVKVNSFVAYALSDDQINHILEKWVEENFTDHCKTVIEYCRDDNAYFSDFVKEKELE